MPKPSKEEPSPRSNKQVNVKPNKFGIKSFFVNFFAKLFNRNNNSKKTTFYEAIKGLKSGGKKNILDNKTILNNFLDFSNKTAEDVLIPRSDIAAVKLDISLELLSQKIIDLPHTRILVYNDTLDDIVGFIHIKDLFKSLVEKIDFQLHKLLRTPIISPPSMKLIDLLIEMQRKRTHIAIVVDEYGGTDGIVTIEDIIEAIVGRIDDEHDKQLESDSYKIINSNTILSHARVKVKDLETILGVKLKNDHDEFDTIGGLVLAKIGNVPPIGTKIEIADIVELEVTDANPRTLKQVKLQLKNAQHLYTNTIS